MAGVGVGNVVGCLSVCWSVWLVVPSSHKNFANFRKRAYNIHGKELTMYIADKEYISIRQGDDIALSVSFLKSATLDGKELEINNAGVVVPDLEIGEYDIIVTTIDREIPVRLVVKKRIDK